MLRLEGLPNLHLWSQIIEVMTGKKQVYKKASKGESAIERYDRISLEYTDWVPPSMPPLEANTKLAFVQDNDAVIKMVVKGRAHLLKHVSVKTRPCLVVTFTLAYSSLICLRRDLSPASLGPICAISCALARLRLAGLSK